MYEPNQLVEQAILFATEAHRGQLRKGSNLPYILHPLEAAAIVAGLTDDPEVIAAAVLHDVLEDTSATPGELEAAFGPRVTALVQSESENKRPHLDPRDSWQLRKQEALEELAEKAKFSQHKMTMEELKEFDHWLRQALARLKEKKFSWLIRLVWAV